VIGHLGLQGVVEWVTDLFVPKQVVLLDGFGVCDGCFQIEATVGINGQA